MNVFNVQINEIVRSKPAQMITPLHFNSFPLPDDEASSSVCVVCPFSGGLVHVHGTRREFSRFPRHNGVVQNAATTTNDPAIHSMSGVLLFVQIMYDIGAHKTESTLHIPINNCATMKSARHHTSAALSTVQTVRMKSVLLWVFYTGRRKK